MIDGDKAQLRLVPQATRGAPSGCGHVTGELVLDRAGTLFILAADSTTLSSLTNRRCKVDWQGV